MSPQAVVAPIVKSSDVFKPDIFKGKVLLCTGGGSGICKTMTLAMMSHQADAAILGRNLERLNEASKELAAKTGQTCLPLQCDVRDPSSVQAASLAYLRALCSAAGNFLSPISLLSEKGFRTVIEIDTLGTYHTVKATLPHVRKSHGSYVHVSATFTHNATPYQVHVSAAKAAVNALSAVLAIEEGPHGVRSNVLSPGPVGDTEGADRLSTKGEDGERYQKSVFPYPLGRIGAMDDCASAAVFLFSDAASFVTGQNLFVDGGTEHVRSALVPYPAAVLDPNSIKHMIKPRM
ncbi:NAD-P-binding protein [Flagelloscypha sp. PMI_526]|nr:NAD-P-binding protein [Flagelloscypha sp. PMI_526]